MRDAQAGLVKEGQLQAPGFRDWGGSGGGGGEAGESVWVVAGKMFSPRTGAVLLGELGGLSESIQAATKTHCRLIYKQNAFIAYSSERWDVLDLGISRI